MLGIIVRFIIIPRLSRLLYRSLSGKKIFALELKYISSLKTYNNIRQEDASHIQLLANLRGIPDKDAQKYGAAERLSVYSYIMILNEIIFFLDLF